MILDVWIDIVCPWSYLGKRHLDIALAHDAQLRDIEVCWRSFELRPHHHREQRESLAEIMARNYQMSPPDIDGTFARLHTYAKAAGLTLQPESIRPVNSFDAHRLIRYATDHNRAATTIDLLFAAYHTRLLNIAEHDVLHGLAAEAELDIDDVDAMLGSDRYADRVRTDEHRAPSAGVTEVPTFQHDGHTLVSGGSTPDELQSILAHLVGQ